MTYSHVVMWLWVAAVLLTLFGLGMALWALVRAERATDRVREAASELDTLGPLTVSLDTATRDTARQRMLLHTRAQTPSD